MKQQEYKNQTFSLPIEIAAELHSMVKRREMSRFVADAIRKELEAKKQELRNAYISANKDPGQIQAANEWQGTLEDGVNDW
jgi:metal-responsive CopG/Arc/MetJ family transcriptional regulator